MNMFLNIKLEYFISFLFTSLYFYDKVTGNKTGGSQPFMSTPRQGGGGFTLLPSFTAHHFSNKQCHGKLGWKDPHLGQVYFLSRGSLSDCDSGRGWLGVLWAVSLEESSVSTAVWLES